jgi:RNA polymerase sigma factor (sigma-70 family)
MVKTPRPIDQIIDIHQKIKYYYHEDYDLKRDEIMSYNDDIDPNAFKANDNLRITDKHKVAITRTIHSTKVYTSQAQMKMFKKYNCLKHIAELARKGLVEPPLSEIQTSDIETWLECQRQFPVIRNKLLQNNIKLLIFCVNETIDRAYGLGLEYDQTVSDCVNRMFIIVDGYNPNLNFQFSTYLYRSISRYIYQLSKLNRRQNSRFTTCGDKDLTEYNDDPDQRLSLISDIKMLEDAICILNEREQTILRYRFGIGVEKMTLKDLGAKLGLTRERIRQIEMAAINKIRIQLSLKNKDYQKQLAKLIAY